MATSRAFVSLDQKEACVSIITDVVRKEVGEAIEELRFSGAIDKPSFQKAIESKLLPAAAAKAVRDVVKKKIIEIAKNISGCLKTYLSVVIQAAPERKISDCFTDTSRYYYRDSNLDSWLPKVQKAQEAGNAISCQLIKASTFVEMVQSSLQTDETNIKKLSRMMKVFTLPQIETLIECQEKGEDVGLRTDGWGNFFPVLNKDEETVSIVHVYRHESQWYVGVIGLEYDHRWSAGDRFFSRN